MNKVDFLLQSVSGEEDSERETGILLYRQTRSQEDLDPGISVQLPDHTGTHSRATYPRRPRFAQRAERPYPNNRDLPELPGS